MAFGDLTANRCYNTASQNTTSNIKYTQEDKELAEDLKLFKESGAIEESEYAELQRQYAEYKLALGGEDVAVRTVPVVTGNDTRCVRKTTQINGETYSVYFTYNAEGNILEKKSVNAAGKTIHTLTYSYQADGRLASVTGAAGEYVLNSEAETFGMIGTESYDYTTPANGWTVTHNGTGKEVVTIGENNTLVSTYNGVTTTTKFDEKGNIKEKEVIGKDGKRTVYSDYKTTTLKTSYKISVYENASAKTPIETGTGNEYFYGKTIERTSEVSGALGKFLSFLASEAERNLQSIQTSIDGLEEAYDKVGDFSSKYPDDPVISRFLEELTDSLNKSKEAKKFIKQYDADDEAEKAEKLQEAQDNKDARDEIAEKAKEYEEALEDANDLVAKAEERFNTLKEQDGYDENATELDKLKAQYEDLSKALTGIGDNQNNIAEILNKILGKLGD